MKRILIAEDETTSRGYLQRVFEEDGYEVAAAAGGSEAIRIGTSFHPDVLIADWMLKDRYHGLEVAQALGHLNPRLRIILVTGFPSDDLRDEAREIGVFQMIEKPFALSDLERAVARALGHPSPRRPAILGIAEVDAGGGLGFANERARELFAKTRAGEMPGSLQAVLPDDALEELGASQRAWLAVRPLSEHNLIWRVRMGPPREDGVRILVLRDATEGGFTDRGVVDALLATDPAPGLWPFPEVGVVILDTETRARTEGVRLLLAARALCFGAANGEEALRLLRADARLRVVLLGWDGQPGLEALPEMLRAAQPDALLVGASREPRLGELAALGIQLFLRKPWTLRELIDRVSPQLRQPRERSPSG